MSCSSELPKWKNLVHARIAELGSIQKVADELGYARSSLSLALRDKYVGSTEQLEKESSKCWIKLNVHIWVMKYLVINVESLKSVMLLHKILPK